MLSPSITYECCMTTSTPVLQIKGLTKHYGGVRALTDAGFVLLNGEHAAIVGDNGAGKSTFVRLITGVEQPSAGQIQLNGQNVAFS
jgi:ABC-type sugar transport system ATPase subunit